jgi:hypothetical protein
MTQSDFNNVTIYFVSRFIIPQHKTLDNNKYIGILSLIFGAGWNSRPAVNPLKAESPRAQKARTGENPVPIVNEDISYGACY